MKKTILFLAILFPGYCFSQLHLSFSSGLAGFEMQDMKKHQLEIKAQFPADVKIIESFPSFWFYEFSITGDITSMIRIGSAVGFTSTGGRMHYKDYSGKIESNQNISSVTFAVQSEVLLNVNEKWPVYFVGKVGAAFARYDLDLILEVNDVNDSDNLKLNSTNIFVTPGLSMYKRIVGPLSANLMAGYEVDVSKGKQKLAENNNLFLLDDSGNEVNLDWSGFRVAVGLSIML
jgi:hypothetical protein